MGNQLFQQARSSVQKAEEMLKYATTPQLLAIAQEEIMKAKNQLSSAFAHSSIAEKNQLSQLQDHIDQMEKQLPEIH